MALPLSSQILVGLVVGGAALYLVSTGSGEGVLEYVFVDRVVDAPASYSGRTIKVHGVVVPGTVMQKKGAAGDYTFEIEKDGRRLPVHFTSMVPDTFAEVRNAPLWKNWAPRLSLTYDLTGQGKTVLKISAGKYLDQIGTGTPGPNPNGTVSQRYTWNDQNGDLFFQKGNATWDGFKYVGGEFGPYLKLGLGYSW